jgi:MFS transporter, OFA family, oxalate/formate antiporter
MDTEPHINATVVNQSDELMSTRQDLYEELDIHQKSDHRKGVLNAIGGVSLMFFLGCFYLWGNISIYVLSYFYEFNPDIDLGFIFIVDTLLIVANTCGYNIGTFLLNYVRLNPRLIVAMGGGFALTGVFLSSFTKSLGPYLACYTGMNGIGCGTCYMVPLVCAWEYFPEKKGLMTGIIIGAYGFGSFGFSLISTALVNPTGADPTIEDGDLTFFDASVADRVPYMIRTLVYIWICFVTIGVLLISRKPKERVELAVKRLKEQKALEDLSVPTQDSEEIIDRIVVDKYEIKAFWYCFYSKRFWQYFTIMVCGNFFATFFSYTYKAYGEDSALHKPISDTTLTWAASIGGGLVNGCSRLCMGTL